jgi:hypothetical protein
MPTPWLAVDAGADLLPWARLLRRAYDSAAGGGKPASILRPLVVGSWRRSRAAGVDPCTAAPIVMDTQDALRRFDEHPLRSLLAHVDGMMLSVARCAGQIVAIADADGLVLWTGGDPRMMCAAGRVHLVPGALWAETHAGTSALAMALELDHAVQVFSAEHFKQPMHGWSSAAAPVHDPETKQILGVLTLSGPLQAAHPHGFSVVLAATQLAEADSAHLAAERNERLKVDFLQAVLRGYPTPAAVVNLAGQVLLTSPAGWFPRHLHLASDGTFMREPAEPLSVEPLESGEGFFVRPACEENERRKNLTLRLRALGRDQAQGLVGRQVLRLTRRHSEIVVILALHPAGLSDEDLMLALYGKTCRKVTVRAEISRLRKLLGPLILTRPYRLASEVRADFLDVERLVAAGRFDAAAKRYRGPLLPSSTAPRIVAARRRLEGLVASDSASDIGAPAAAVR